MAWFASTPGLWGAWGELGHSVRTGGTGVKRAFGVEAWEYLNAHP